MKVPLSTISRIVSFVDILSSDNSQILKNGNKNQRLVRKYCSNFILDFCQNNFFEFIFLI